MKTSALSTDQDSAAVIKKLKAQLAREIEKNRQLNDLVQSMTQRDDLTGLFNDTYFEKLLQGMFYDCQRYQKSFCIILACVDRVRQIKEKTGAAGCDALYKSIGEYLLRALRQTDWAGRLSANEFAIILPFTTLEDAARMADRFRRYVAKFEMPNDYKATVSVGVARSTESDSCSHLFEIVRDRYKAAKSNGRNCVVYKSLIK